MTIQLRGVFTALVTPFAEDGSVAETTLRRLVRRQIDGGVAGLVPVGTTGEATTLDPDEHQRVVETVVDEVRRGSRTVPVIAGAGTNSTRKTIDLARRCRSTGADALLLVTPYYNKPPQTGLQAHYRSVAQAVDLPVVLYNVPSRTGVHLSAETVLELAQEEPFVGVKEASGRLDEVSEILRGRPEGFAVLSGEDSLTLPLVALGGDGVIAVVANEAPALLVDLVEAALAGERDRAARLHARLFPLMRANFVETNPIPVKWALHRMGLIEPHLRPPLIPLAAHRTEAVERALEAVGLLDSLDEGSP
ncbi:MAG: 4-hydroxy-tetrahydrodipicolinate synthase [Thermoanaerobaculia bacterium]|nr:4-hydroxy-tetrahydrodipicolinate synthase [Thermoanaerobaculia bacterium]